jgi:hypothetical protein
MTKEQLKEEAKKEYSEAVRYGNEEDFINSQIDKAFEEGKKEERQEILNHFKKVEMEKKKLQLWKILVK